MRTRSILTFALAAIIFAMAAVLATAQEPAPAKAPDLGQMLAQRTNQLGACNSELGPLQQLQAAVIAGQLVEPIRVREAFEKANPGKTFGADFVLVDRKPAEGK